MNEFTQSFFNQFRCIHRPGREPEKNETIFRILCIVFTIVYGVSAYFLFQQDILPALLSGIKKGMVAYLCYLLIIELAPDQKNLYLYSFLAVCLSLIPNYNYSLFGTLFILFCTRVVTQSSGYSIGIPESIVLFLYGIILYSFIHFVYPFILGMSLLIDYKYRPRSLHKLIFGILSLILSVLWVVNFAQMTRDPFPLFWIIIVILTVVLYIFRISLIKTSFSFDDLQQKILSPKRLKSANFILIIALTIMSVGYSKTTEFGQLWILMLTLSLPYFKDIIQTNIRKEES